MSVSDSTRRYLSGACGVRGCSDSNANCWAWDKPPVREVPHHVGVSQQWVGRSTRARKNEVRYRFW
eukprot:3906440-Lingulodinium_polyedra.AAC.1